MPELPEVETIVRGLKKEVIGKMIKDIWTDWPKYFRLSYGEKIFRKNLIGKKILDVQRRAKNILFYLSDDYVLLVHQKMTGHLMIGEWEMRQGKWESLDNGVLKNDRVNGYIRFLMKLDDGRMVALSDLRRFAKIICDRTEKISRLPDLQKLGPEPLVKDFTFKKFRDLFQNKKGKTKQILLDQNFISGIGNIYADEILWYAKIHPLKRVEELSVEELKILYRAIQFILKKAVKLKGSSFDDYRDVHGKKGNYMNVRYVYQRKGEKCSRCGMEIKKIKVGERGTHFCPKCQGLNNNP